MEHLGLRLDARKVSEFKERMRTQKNALTGIRTIKLSFRETVFKTALDSIYFEVIAVSLNKFISNYSSEVNFQNHLGNRDH